MVAMTGLDVEQREKISRYLSDDLTLEAFYRWFTPEAWNIHQRADRQTAEVFHEVDLLLAEFAQGDWDEQEVKRRLTPFVTTYVIRSGGAQSWGSTGEVNVLSVLLASVPAQARFAGK